MGSSVGSGRHALPSLVALDTPAISRIIAAQTIAANEMFLPILI
jgi:hypothetical protein